MMYKISKELFETVFKGCVFSKINQEDFLIEYTQPCVIIENSWVNSEISINDFFFECKEWAYEQGFVLRSWQGPDIASLYNTDAKPIGFCKIGVGIKFSSFSEQQAVFDACQWILDKKGN